MQQSHCLRQYKARRAGPGRRSPRVDDGVGDPVAAAFRAAWALVASIAPSEQTPAALANLALMFSEFGSPSAAVESWKRVRWGDRNGLGDGTVRFQNVYMLRL